jgi:hypothetical protein
MRESTVVGGVLVGMGALFALGASVLVNEARPPHRSRSAPVAAVASCLVEVQGAVSCTCVRGHLRHYCQRALWQAMRDCRDGQPGGGSEASRARHPMVWCGPRNREVTI